MPHPNASFIDLTYGLKCYVACEAHYINFVKIHYPSQTLLFEYEINLVNERHLLFVLRLLPYSRLLSSKFLLRCRHPLFQALPQTEVDRPKPHHLK